MVVPPSALMQSERVTMTYEPRAARRRQLAAGPAGRGPKDRDGARISGKLARVVGAVLVCVGLNLVAAAGARAYDEVRIGETLREASLQGLNGPSRRLAQYRGRPLLINVWASWCGPCMDEMASLERLAWMDDRAPFAVIGISTDDDPQSALAVLRRTNATISHFIDHDLQMEHMLGADQIPLTVLVDAEGRVRDKIYGARRWDTPESLQRIERALRPRIAGTRRTVWNGKAGREPSPMR
jgi:thiol-disulfide isomerase/thioredoxin